MSGLSTVSRRIALPLALAVAFAAGFQLCLGATYFGVADEGFLWYGVQRVRAGEVPMRDFQAYDPGRYYWCAAWSFLFGQGIVGVRAGAAAFQALGLFCGLLVARRNARSIIGLVLCAAILGFWIFPRHKLFEPALAMAAVWFGVRLVEDPGPRRVLLAGAFTGLAAWFGRNHVLYLVLGYSALGSFLSWKGALRAPRRSLAAFTLGCALGSLPVWGMALLVPGFGAGFAGSIRHLVEVGSNLHEPWPWPWRLDLAGRHGFFALGTVALTLAFLLPVLAYPAGLLVALRTRREELVQRAVPIAATLIGVFYVHHVAVRSDAYHLAQSIHPTLLLAMSLPAALAARVPVRTASAAALAVVTFFAVPVGNPILAHMVPGGEREFVDHDVAGETLRLPKGQARLLANVEAACERIGPAEPLFIAPARPAYYPLLGRTSPTFWIYILWALSEEEQQEIVRRLDEGGVNWVLIVDSAVDDRPEQRFMTTNPLVWSRIAQSFRAVPDSRLPPAHYLFRREDG